MLENLTPSARSDARVETRILMVDDTETKRYANAEILRRAGFRVSEAASGKDGLWAALTDRPDLVVLDVRLPDISGFEACRILKTNPETASIPVLHLSAHHTGAEDQARGLALADGYLTGAIEPEVLLATIRSLLRARRSEEAARALAQQWQTTFDAIGDCVCIVDEEGLIVRANSATAVLFSCRVEQLEGRGYVEALRVAFGDDALEEGVLPRSSDSREIPLHTKGIWISYRCHPAEAAQGVGTSPARVRRWVHVISDITERKRAELERDDLLRREQAARGQAERLYEAASNNNRLKDEFLATLSHELRTPLNVILGHAELLQMADPTERELNQSIDAIARSARAQSQLVADLLDVSRIITGKLDLEVSVVDLADLVETALDTVRLAAAAKRISLSRRISANLPRVEADPGRLRQILWNLLANAVKFTSAGGAVALEAFEEDAFVCVQVCDNGQGIQAEFLPHVFERFRQEDATTTRRFGGLGLGLAIVRHLAELHGGSIHVESEGRERGATFTLRLPHPHFTPETEGIERAEGPLGHDTLRGLKVLLVDDHADALEIERLILTSSGIDVTTATSAADALRALERFQPEVLVCDISMPDEDGFSLLRRIREREQAHGSREHPLPAIAVTAHASESDAREVLLAGFEAHIAKPIDTQKLFSSLAAVVASRRARERARPLSR